MQDRDENLRDRAADATSDETLNELEEQEKVGVSRKDDTDVPSPDSEPADRSEQRDDVDLG